MIKQIVALALLLVPAAASGESPDLFISATVVEHTEPQVIQRREVYRGADGGLYRITTILY